MGFNGQREAGRIVAKGQRVETFVPSEDTQETDFESGSSVVAAAYVRRQSRAGMSFLLVTM